MTEPPAFISRAQAIAQEAHEGQTDKAGQPYIEHPRAVAAQAAIYSQGDPAVIAAAWLHDVVEDTEWTLDSLSDEGIPDEVLVLIEAVTRGEGEEYLGEFIPRVVAAGRKAVLLKLADIWHNTHPYRRGTLSESLEKRYAAAKAMLEASLEFSR